MSATRAGRITRAGADRHLTARREEAKNDEPLFVREELQEPRRLVCAANDRTDFRQF